MDAPRAPEFPGYDRPAAVEVLSRALGQRGGPGLVVAGLGSLPGASVTSARSGFFRSSPMLVQLGQWRYEARGDVLATAHVVGGIAVAQAVLTPVNAGEHVAGALGAFLAEQGERSLPDVLALLEGLAVASA